MTTTNPSTRNRRICMLTVTLLFCIQSMLFAAPRVFTSSSGKTIQGNITFATEKEVTIKLANGQEVTGGISFFSAEDQKYIADWRKKNPPQVKYDFETAESRTRVDRDKVQEGSIIVVYEKWAYEITIENRSKIGLNGVDLSGVELHYNVAKTANANAKQASYLHQGMKSSNGCFVLAGKVGLKTLEYLRDAEAKTDSFPINQSELAPGYYYTDGSKDEQNDDSEGIWYKLVKDGKVIHEVNKLSKKGERIKWVNPGNKRD